MPPNNAPTVARVGQAPGNATKGVDVILLGDLNVRPREPYDVQEEELVTVVADCGLEDTTAHFMPRRRYRGEGRWKYWNRREDRQVMGQGYYLLCTSRHTFFNAGVREARMHIDHRMVLEVLRGEGEHRNGTYQWRSKCWWINPRKVQPLMRQPKGRWTGRSGQLRRKRPGYPRRPGGRQTDRQTAPQGAGRASATELRQAQR